MIYRKGTIETLSSLTIPLGGLVVLYASVKELIKGEYFTSLFTFVICVFLSWFGYYILTKAFDKMEITCNGIKGSIHRSYNIKPIKFDIYWDEILWIKFAPGTKLRFILTISTANGNEIEVCSDSIGKFPKEILLELLKYKYVEIEHYWKDTPIKDNEMIEYAHDIVEKKGKITECFSSTNDDNIWISNDYPYWQEYLLKNKFDSSHILSVLERLAEKITINTDKEFIEFLKRIKVFALVQCGMYSIAEDTLCTLNDMPCNGLFKTKEAKYLKYKTNKTS